MIRCAAAVSCMAGKFIRVLFSGFLGGFIRCFSARTEKGLDFYGGGYNGNGKQFQKGHAF